MILGRRNFLKFFTAAIAGYHTSSLSGAVRSPTAYASRKLGFGFKIPNGWHLETFREDFYELLGGQKLADSYSEDEETLKELGEGLMATLSKYPLTGDAPRRFSPSVTFFKDTDEYLSEVGDLKTLASQAVLGFSKVLTDYECIKPPAYLERDDCAIVRSKSKFLFENEEISSVFIDDEMFLLHYQRKLYTIHLYDSPYIGDTSQDEFKFFRNSLHIA